MLTMITQLSDDAVEECPDTWAQSWFPFRLCASCGSVALARRGSCLMFDKDVCAIDKIIDMVDRVSSREESGSGVAGTGLFPFCLTFHSSLLRRSNYWVNMTGSSLVTGEMLSEAPNLSVLSQESTVNSSYRTFAFRFQL